jgi:hypothetical protein
MEKQTLSFVGVDPTAGLHSFTFAAVNQDCELVSLATGDTRDVLAFLTSHQANIVAINAPPRPNQGLVRKNLENLNRMPGQLRGSNIRQAESELRERGIMVMATPSHYGICPAWMQMGFSLYEKIEELGYKQYPAEKPTQQWLETQPHAAFCALLGQIPLPKPTLEGRLQRQTVLYEQGAGINDPMEFFEEITRHKLLRGTFPMELIYASEGLDTLMAAYVAYCVIMRPQNTIMIGDSGEGQITLPVAALKDSYHNR